jgi:hypothetical protein
MNPNNFPQNINMNLNMQPIIINNNNQNIYNPNIGNKNKIKIPIKNKYSPQSDRTKNKNKNEMKNKWKQVKINDIIPFENLSKLDNKTILLNGIFHVFTKKNLTNKQETTIKYVALTKSEIRIYRSKESILFEKNPLIRISLFNISKCDIYCNNNPNINNFALQGKNIYKFFIESVTLNNMENDDKPIIIIRHKTKKYESENTGNLNKKKRKKMSFLKENLIENLYLKNNNSELFNKENREKNNSVIFVFSSEDEKIINEWIALINFLIR